jgi:hypothetical protein
LTLAIQDLIKPLYLMKAIGKILRITIRLEQQNLSSRLSKIGVTMEIAIKLSSKELSEILGDKFGSRLLEKISNGDLNLIQVDSKTENREKEFDENDKKTAFVDDMSWVAFYVYDFIELNHTDESDEFYLLKESNIKAIMISTLG